MDYSIDGYDVSVTFDHDDTHGAPWEECDGHGVVSGWERRAKRAGEKILCSDRGARLFYDVQETMRIAIRDGWNAEPYDQGTKREKAARAVARDFDYLRGWCNSEWHYLVVGVTVTRNGEHIGEDYLGGVESGGTYAEETAREMAENIIAEDQETRRVNWLGALHEARERKYWAARDVATV